MDLIDDEPRRNPKPVPFCQNALLQPVVPDVSLLFQNDSEKQSGKKNDSFTGTEFQTYNSWRWKHMNPANRNTPSPELKTVNKYTTNQDCFLIKDKYFTSDIEKRKNEILYGEFEEPRRPLPPRASPMIPSCVESFFSNSSFEDLKPVHSNQETEPKIVNPVSLDKNMTLNYTNKTCFKKESDCLEKLYSIISEQNKQMQTLQNQIEQLLKLQEVKDKHIEQLLKSQESKEKKIEQLLESVDLKEKEIRQLTSAKDKHEQHLQELLKSQENMQKENNNLVRKLNELKLKDVVSVGVMACVQVADANTCMSLDDIVWETNNKKSDTTIEEDISCIRNASKFDERDRSLSLHSSDLPVIQESALTPQSSIHVDIQDFPESSDESGSESNIPSTRFTASKEEQSSPLGYTFYNNVLTQLKGIIQNSGEKDSDKSSNKKSGNHERLAGTDYNFAMENLETFSGKENDPSFSNVQQKNERFPEQLQNICKKDTNSPSDISLKINALAMKYLKQEQIPDFGLQTHVPSSCQHDVTIYNVTNLSFGSMRYLDRYQILPKMKDNQRQIMNITKNENSPAELLCRKKRLTIEENIKSIGNILDMTTLNQQPKLL